MSLITKPELCVMSPGHSPGPGHEFPGAGYSGYAGVSWVSLTGLQIQEGGSVSLTTFPTPGESWHLVRPGSESGAESGNAGLWAAPGERHPDRPALSLLLNVAFREWVSQAVVGNKPSFPCSRPRPHCRRGSTGQGSGGGEASQRVLSAPHRLWVSSCLVSAGNAISHQEKVPQRSSSPCPG